MTDKNEIANAIDLIGNAIKNDDELAWGWLSNIAMSCYDEGCDHVKANKGAARFIKQLFDVDVEHLIDERVKSNMSEPDGMNASASEAVYGFAGWLTTRDEKTIMSASNDAAEAARLVATFCAVNNLSDPRNGWEKKLTHPEPSAKTS